MIPSLLNRELGKDDHSKFSKFVYNQQLQQLNLSSKRFSKNNKEVVKGKEKEDKKITVKKVDSNHTSSITHFGGVNSLTIDPFDGRYMLSGGGDSKICIWDLETSEIQASEFELEWKSSNTIVPLGVTSSDHNNLHKFGITDLSFYPFDASAFLSSSYDNNLKIYSTSNLTCIANFDLDAPIYSFSLSKISPSPLVACATHLPSIRLVDLRSGSYIHSLPGHIGAILNCVWSPTEENILASAGTDGTIRLWDIRKAIGQIGSLNKDDSIGILGYDNQGINTGHNTSHNTSNIINRGKAHEGIVNGIVWHESGKYLISYSQEEENIRVWDMMRGSNMLINFGSGLKNSCKLSKCLPCLVPETISGGLGKDVMIFPGEKDILFYDLFKGRLLSRYRIPLNGKLNRAKDLQWRKNSVELYSAHSNGCIHSWKSNSSTFELEDDKDEENDKKLKRKLLDDIYNDVYKGLDNNSNNKNKKIIL